MLARSDGLVAYLRRGVRVALVVGLLLLASACSSDGYEQQTFPVSSGHFNHPVVIGAGRLGTDTWTLLADQSGDGKLCMGVGWRPASDFSDYSCGFGSNQIDDEGRDTQPADVSVSRQGLALAFGPSPAGAVRVSLTMPKLSPQCGPGTMPATSVAVRHRIPDWYPNPGTGWFAVAVPPEAAECALDARFVDENDDEVAQPINF